MKSVILLASLIAVALPVSGSAMASDALAVKHKCNMCHDMDKKKVGPSWKDIAAKNKGQAGAEKALADAIVMGSKANKYGKMPMPPQPAAKADADALAKWILAL